MGSAASSSYAGSMTAPRLFIFARYPRPGEAKTRLIPALGADGAANLYARMLEATILTARESGLPFELRITGASPDAFRQRFGKELSISEQGTGDLGARLRRIAPPALIVGSDAPGLTPALLQQAANRLLRHELVIGPASDGGYYLIGLARPMPWLFGDMPWSTSRLLDATLQRCQVKAVRPAMLPMLDDIDTPDDLARWPALTR